VGSGLRSFWSSQGGQAFVLSDQVRSFAGQSPGRIHVFLNQQLVMYVEERRPDPTHATSQVAPPPDLDLNTLGMNTYSLTARRHFRPVLGFTPFAGAGTAITTFGNLEERFGNRIELDFDPAVSWLMEGGVRYNFHGRLWLDAALSYMRLEAEPSHVRNETDIELPPRIDVDPLTLSVGAAWRF
jgi:outer membrane protein W